MSKKPCTHEIVQEAMRRVSKDVISNIPMHKNKIFACKKIITTTDNSLNIIYDGTTPISKDWNGKQLPQPSPQFIAKYIEEYNKGNVIAEVLVEYEQYWDKNTFPKHMPTFKIKVDSQNRITITKVKNTVKVGEELYSIMQQYHEYCVWKEYITPQNWISQNL